MPSPKFMPVTFPKSFPWHSPSLSTHLKTTGHLVDSLNSGTPLPPCSCCLPADFGTFPHPGDFSNLETKVLQPLISLKPALGSWLLRYGSHTDKCTKWQLTARRRQNTYKKQTQKLLHDSGLGAWAFPVIPSVHSPPRENWQAGIQQLSTLFSAGLFSAQETRS